MSRPTKPSWWWLAATAFCGAVTIGAASAAVLLQRAADRPVGEGDVFLEDARFASDQVRGMSDEGMALADAARHIRNTLTIEAVAVVDQTGQFTNATSANLVGDSLDNGLLLFGLSNGSFAAIAASIPEPLSIDGVVEWAEGDVLYQVLYPLGDDQRALVLYYDIGQLLERRAGEAGIQTETLWALGISALFLFLAAALAVGRSQARRRYQLMAVESDFLRKHSEELEAYNIELDIARREAERALELAEEKNRIRSEFVLMINHELRTPLTAVVTGAHLLQSNGSLSSGDREQLIEDMIRDGNRLNTIIAQMLAVARIENRGLDYELRSVPLAEVCEEIEASHPRLAIERDAGVSPGDRGEIQLRTDPQTLAQLVGSLTDNAYTHGATKVSVSCSAMMGFVPMAEVGERPERAVHFAISDNGPGIDPEFLPRAFEKFEKQSRSAGTGLGLYVASMMVEAIEGSMAVRTSSEGTTVSLAVPVVVEPELQEATA